MGHPKLLLPGLILKKDGNSILINTAEGRIKHKNVPRDLRIAISISDLRCVVGGTSPPGFTGQFYHIKII
jgi:hypothetical protein